MTPVAVFETLLKVNKPAAAFILAGLGLIAAAAIAVTFVGGNQNAMTLGFYILGFAVLVTILMFVVGNERMRSVLGWIMVSSFALFMAGLVDAAAQITGRMPIPACYLKMFTQDPNTCMENLYDGVTVTGPQNAIADAVPTTTSARATPVVKQVVLHYGPAIDKNDMVKLAGFLDNLGWPLKNSDDGGQLVNTAPSTNQIRYYDPDDRKAAIALAAEISSAMNKPKIEVRDFSTSGLIAPDGLLEVWVTS